MNARHYISCTRMYNATAPVTDAWQRLMAEVSRISGVPLRFDLFPFPNDITQLWARADLGCAFICGRPFSLGGLTHRPVAVPLRERAHGEPLYNTKLLARADGACNCLEDTFGLRLGLTTPHSLSGFKAVKDHLAPYQAASKKPLYAEEIGGLHTPANCLNALADCRADVVPMDGYYYELLSRHAPGALAGTKVIAETRCYPMPLLVASPQLADTIYDALREGLFTAAKLPTTRPILDILGLSGFAAPEVAAYESLAEDMRQEP